MTYVGRAALVLALSAVISILKQTPSAPLAWLHAEAAGGGG